MAELRYVERAAYSPTQCAICQTHEGPFIDTSVEFIGYGHVYICASHEGRSGCVRQMATRDGMVPADTVALLTSEVDKLQQREAELESQLADARVVPMQEVVDYLSTRIVARPAPAPAGRE